MLNKVNVLRKSHIRLHSKIIIESNSKMYWLSDYKFEKPIDLGNLDRTSIENFFDIFQRTDFCFESLYEFSYHNIEYFVWTLNHIIADGYSMNVLLSELESESLPPEKRKTLDLLIGDFWEEYVDKKNFVEQWTRENCELKSKINKSSEFVPHNVAIFTYKTKSFLGSDLSIKVVIEAIAAILNYNQLPYTIIINRRIFYPKLVDFIGDLHDEIPCIYHKGEKSTFSSDLKDYNYLNHYKSISDSAIQLNYEVGTNTSLQSEEIENILGTSQKNIERELWETKPISISIVESPGRINFEISSILNSKQLEKINTKLKKRLEL